MNTFQTLLFSAAIALFAACGQSTTSVTEAERTPAIPVRIEPVVTLKENPAILTSGIVAAREEIKLSFKTGGVIRAIYVNEGSTVQKGQLLAKLDPSEIDAQVNQATSAAEKARRDLERAARLYEDTVVTLEIVQDLTTAKDVAEANLRIATFNRQYSEIYAPASGRILKRFAESGEIIGPGSPVFFLAATNSDQVIRAGITDADIVRVNYGDRASVHFDAWPADTFHAQVVEIAAGADPMTGVFSVELQLEKHPKTLKNGFIGQITLIPQTEEKWVKIPLTAVVEAEPRKAKVYTTEPGSPIVKQVILSHYRIGNDHIAVPVSQLNGLTEVITDGARYLKPGSAVTFPDSPRKNLAEKQ
ncbi:MAG: efflux RND transporter periplasmic adaptor subunit [Bacteroidia bacterium]|nr:efflux RND transporter periplasmic adaptor subunit [Bacteroidia bacterium]